MSCRRWVDDQCPRIPNVGEVAAQVYRLDERPAGVPADLVRISVGIEDVDDILWDLDQALAAATKAIP